MLVKQLESMHSLEKHKVDCFGIEGEKADCQKRLGRNRLRR